MKNKLFNYNTNQIVSEAVYSQCPSLTEALAAVVTAKRFVLVVNVAAIIPVTIQFTHAFIEAIITQFSDQPTVSKFG